MIPALRRRRRRVQSGCHGLRDLPEPPSSPAKRLINLPDGGPLLGDPDIELPKNTTVSLSFPTVVVSMLSPVAIPRGCTTVFPGGTLLSLPGGRIHTPPGAPMIISAVSWLEYRAGPGTQIRVGQRDTVLCSAPFRVLPSTIHLSRDWEIPSGSPLRLLSQTARPLGLNEFPPLGAIMPEGTVLLKGTVIPGGAAIPEGTSLRGGLTLFEGTILPEGSVVPAGSYVPTEVIILGFPHAT
ncbi:hypothetical protein F4804DRAFT_335929 [Jackrogersella minutella]|nr:hypothetical protein F4804DRAFT_335929 [Jackrogersella minutella]